MVDLRMFREQMAAIPPIAAEEARRIVAELGAEIREAERQRVEERAAAPPARMRRRTVGTHYGFAVHDADKAPLPIRMPLGVLGFVLPP